MTEDQTVEKEWAKHPEIPSGARKRIESAYQKAYDISGPALAEQIGVFLEAHDAVVSAGGLTDQYKNHAKAGISPYEKALRRSVRLVRDVQGIIASKGLSPSHIDWGIVWSEYRKRHPQARMKSPAVLKASYFRLLRNPRVKEKLFDKDYAGKPASLREIVLHEEDPQVAEMALKAALYDVGQEYGDVVVSGTVIAMRATMGLPLDKESEVSFSESPKEAQK